MKEYTVVCLYFRIVKWFEPKQEPDSGVQVFLYPVARGGGGGGWWIEMICDYTGMNQWVPLVEIAICMVSGFSTNKKNTNIVFFPIYKNIAYKNVNTMFCVDHRCILKGVRS